MENKNVSSPLPAYIFAGPRSVTVTLAEEHMMAVWCATRGCGLCSKCKAVKARSFYLLRWMIPEKQVYTVSQIAEVMHVLSIARDSDEQFYIVFEYAELLSSSSASMLLKSLEEPTPGYRFILLSESVKELLPTIVSRCIIHHVRGQRADEQWDSFLAFFRKPLGSPGAYAEFEKERERIPLEYESRALVEALMAYWLKEYHDSKEKNQHADAMQALRIVTILENSLTCLPMPGSAKLFWRTLFLRMVFLSQP